MQLTNDANWAAGGKANVEQIRTAFSEHEQELTWLAEYLTGDVVMARACVIDARKRTEYEYEIGDEWFCSWPRDATILSAVELQRTRIAQLAAIYDQCGCIHGRQGHLSPETVEFVAGPTGLAGLRFDTLCRFVFVLCCLDERSADEAALFLGISKHTVEGAYCKVLEALELMCCQAICGSCGPDANN
jgi:hypothetical protein